MIFTTRMVQLIAVVLDHDAEAVTKELLNQGVLDFINVKSISGELSSKIEPVVPAVSQAMIREIRTRIEGLLAVADLFPGKQNTLKIEDLQYVDFDEADKYLDSIDRELENRQEKKREYQQEIIKLKDMERQFQMFESIGYDVQTTSPYSFLTIRTGSLPETTQEDFPEKIKEFPSVYIEAGTPDHPLFLLFTMKRDDSRVNKLLETLGWQEEKLPVQKGEITKEAIEDIEKRILSYQEKQENLSQEIQKMIFSHIEKLQTLWKQLSLNELYISIQSRFSKTARTVLFSGWLPAAKQNSLEEGIRKASGDNCYLEWHRPEKNQDFETPKDIPVQMENPAFLKPFQALVERYAVPEYGTVNPTPFVFLTFLIMFGLMFGDAGHGAVLLILGIIGTVLRKRKNKKANLFKLITWCGGSSIITGILFGSYFGMEWFRPFWFDYHGIIAGRTQTGSIQNIYDILKITIYFGITVIGVGLLLNWINCIRKKRWLPLFLAKGGLLGGWIYGAGIYTAFYYVGHNYKELPPGNLLLPLVGIPIILLFAKAPLEFFLPSGHKDRKKFSAFTIMDFIMEWIVEILEIFSGYLANTLSFMRVAGLGIAHVSLMIAFFTIAEMIAPGGGLSAGSIIILIFGNVLVIVLEGLSAGIQSLRLNYYEFFSKYFSGTGKAYNPISLTRKE